MTCEKLCGLQDGLIGLIYVFDKSNGHVKHGIQYGESRILGGSLVSYFHGWQLNYPP